MAQWNFPAIRTYAEERGRRRRHHFHPPAVQQAFPGAVLRTGIEQPPHPTPCATASPPISPKDGYDIRTIQELLSHRDVPSTKMWSHVLNRGPVDVRSPAARLA